MGNAGMRRPQELVIARVIDAPRELVFQAWTRSEHAMQWWGPDGFDVFKMEMDIRPGGKWRKGMRAPDGREWWRHGVYREIVPPERLVFTYFSDDHFTNPGHESLVTVTFEEVGSQTRMTLRHGNFESQQSRDAHLGGWTSTMNRMATLVERAQHE